MPPRPAGGHRRVLGGIADQAQDEAEPLGLAGQVGEVAVAQRRALVDEHHHPGPEAGVAAGDAPQDAGHRGVVDGGLVADDLTGGALHGGADDLVAGRLPRPRRRLQRRSLAGAGGAVDELDALARRGDGPHHLDLVVAQVAPPGEPLVDRLRRHHADVGPPGPLVGADDLALDRQHVPGRVERLAFDGGHAAAVLAADHVAGAGIAVLGLEADDVGHGQPGVGQLRYLVRAEAVAGPFGHELEHVAPVEGGGELGDALGRAHEPEQLSAVLVGHQLRPALAAVAGIDGVAVEADIGEPALPRGAQRIGVDAARPWERGCRRPRSGGRGRWWAGAPPSPRCARPSAGSAGSSR